MTSVMEPSTTAGAASSQMLPLEGLLVLDFSQFLAGPLAALRLADLGARVIKIERPDGGDLCRQLYISNLVLDGDSTLFHSINRNKQSVTANLKDPADLAKVRRLIAKADVLIQNFRPGVIERLGLDYPAVRAINPRIVYASVSGYGNEGPWKDKPGQDLLAQAMSGLTWLSGNAGDGPVPMGLSAADMFAGHFLVQGILACLVRRSITGAGGLVETSLLEALLDFQFEVLTTHFNDGGKPPQRSRSGSANAYLAAPYGVYSTADGYLAIAMNPLKKLAELLDLSELGAFTEAEAFSRRDQIQSILADHLRTGPTQHWLNILEPADVWCAPVLDWPNLLRHEAFRAIGMTQRIGSADSSRQMQTTRCPIRVDGQRLLNDTPAPKLGEHQKSLSEILSL